MIFQIPSNICIANYHLSFICYTAHLQQYTTLLTHIVTVCVIYHHLEHISGWQHKERQSGGSKPQAEEVEYQS